MAKPPPPSSDGTMPPVVVKKYANRRLYNTETSAYITLDHLARMTREGREFQVLDARTDEDITHSVLTQIIMDEESRGAQQMLPPAFLRQLIAMYGDSMQSVIPQYLEASMEAFRRNQAQFNDALKGALTGGPFAEIAKRNMAIFEAATSALTGTRAAAAKEPTNTTASAKDNEIAELKAQLAELHAKVAKLSE